MRGKVNRGRRHEVVNIYEIIDGGISDNGFPIEIKVLKESVQAEVRTISTKEFIAAGRQVSQMMNKFVMPYLDYLTVGEEFEWNGYTWNIQHVQRIDKWHIEATAKQMSRVEVTE